MGVGNFLTALAAPEVSLDKPDRPEILFGRSAPTEGADAVLVKGRFVAAVDAEVVLDVVEDTGAAGARLEAEDMRRKAVEAESELLNPIDERRDNAEAPLTFDAGACEGAVVVLAPRPEERPSVEAEKDEGGDTLLVRAAARPVVPNALSFATPEIEVDIDRRFDVVDCADGLGFAST